MEKLFNFKNFVNESLQFKDYEEGRMSYTKKIKKIFDDIIEKFKIVGIIDGGDKEVINNGKFSVNIDPLITKKGYDFKFHVSLNKDGSKTENFALKITSKDFYLYKSELLKIGNEGIDNLEKIINKINNFTNLPTTDLDDLLKNIYKLNTKEEIHITGNAY